MRWVQILMVHWGRWTGSNPASGCKEQFPSHAIGLRAKLPKPVGTINTQLLTISDCQNNTKQLNCLFVTKVLGSGRLRFDTQDTWYKYQILHQSTKKDNRSPLWAFLMYQRKVLSLPESFTLDRQRGDSFFVRKSSTFFLNWVWLWAFSCVTEVNEKNSRSGFRG